MKKLNLLVLGASGGVSNAFLHHLVNYRSYFDKLILLDKNNRILSNPYLDHDHLDYIFLHQKIQLPQRENEYNHILKKYQVDIVLDLTDMASLPVLKATNQQGVSYLNTAFNDYSKTNYPTLMFNFYSQKDKLNQAPHILCSGMNPGVVNMWVRYGIEKFSKPQEIIHFEYDSSYSSKKLRSLVTWSKRVYLIESVNEVSGIILGKNNAQAMYPNALENKVSMRSILSPILKLKKYPFGFPVLHEENITLAQKFDLPSKFIYSINIETMEHLVKLYQSNKNKARKNQPRQKISINELVLGDNTAEILDGSDTIGVVLDYKDKKVYYLNSISNLAIIGTNATYTQVIIGVFAALFTLLFDRLKSGVYFVEDLFQTHFKNYLFDNMRVQEFVFKKEGRKLKLISYNPMIKIKKSKKFKHIYTI